MRRVTGHAGGGLPWSTMDHEIVPLFTQPVVDGPDMVIDGGLASGMFQ